MKIWQLDGSTLLMCDGCLHDLGPIPGKWAEEPLKDCSICGEVDLQSREEMDQFHHDMSNLQWEEDQQDDRIITFQDPQGDPWWSPDEPNPQELK